MNGSAPAIILASASPRRRLLFRLLEIPHEIKAANVDERAITAASPREFALKAAFLKAGALDEIAPTGTIVVAADTIVVLRDKIYFKPENPHDAIRMLGELSGQTHQVMTGIAVREAGKATQLDAVTTDVRIKSLTPEEITAYVATGEPLDKAGSYGIQGLGGKLVEQVIGDYFNVVGLPVDKLLEMLAPHIDTTPNKAARRRLTPELFNNSK